VKLHFSRRWRGPPATDRLSRRIGAPFAGTSVDKGKRPTEWRKVDGTWKVAADMANSDLPMTG